MYFCSGTGPVLFFSALSGIFRGMILLFFLFFCTLCGKDEGRGIYGTYVDPDDGEVYRTIEIGEQTWLADNISSGEMVAGSSEQTDNGIAEKYCYDDNPENCRQYGGLYQWGEAMGYEENEAVQGICPSGFHLPTDSDWKELEIYLGMSPGDAGQIFWRGTDEGERLKVRGDTGFRSLFAGNRYITGTFNKKGERTFFWTSTEHSAGYAWGRALDIHEKKIYRAYFNTSYGFSVRCIMTDSKP